MNRGPLVIAMTLLLGCGTRTLADGFNIDTSLDGATVDTGGDSNIIEVPAKQTKCGSDQCVVGIEDCCIAGFGGAAGATCRPAGTCPRGLVLSCSSPASCEGNRVCCLRVRDMGGSATCTDSCSGRGTTTLCDTDADCSMGRTCRPAMFGGFRVCI